MANVTFCDACKATIDEVIGAGYPRHGCRLVRMAGKDLDLCGSCFQRLVDVLGIKYGEPANSKEVRA